MSLKHSLWIDSRGPALGSLQAAIYIWRRPCACSAPAGACSFTAGASSVQARFSPVTVQTRCLPGPSRCLLDAGSATASAGSVPAGAGSVLAWFPPVPVRCRLGPRRGRLDAGSVPVGRRRCWLGAALVPAGASSVPVHFLFIQIKYHRLPRDQSALIPQTSYCIHASISGLPGPTTSSGLKCAFMRDPRSASPKSQSAHHKDWKSFGRLP